MSAGLLLSGLACSQAIVIRHDKSDSLYTGLAAQTQFAAVGRIDVKFPGESYQPLGSATLIASNWIIGAAHIFDINGLTDSQTGHFADGLRFVLGNQNYTISLSGSSAIHLHPGWVLGSFDLLNDIAMVQLSGSSPVTPAALFAGSVPLHSSITIVGYGNTGTGQSGSSATSSEKRAAQNALDDFVDETQFEIDFDRPNSPTYSSYGSSAPLELEGNLGPGDSGGSAWYQSLHGWGIVGINSYGIDYDARTPEDGYGDRSGFTYVPEFMDWITSFGAFTVIPEPGVFALLGMGLLLLRRRR